MPVLQWVILRYLTRIPMEKKSKQYYFELTVPNTWLAALLMIKQFFYPLYMMILYMKLRVTSINTSLIFVKMIFQNEGGFYLDNQNFNGLLEVHLKHNRYGLVLFLKNCNLVAAMSSALGKQVMGVKHAHAQGVK